MRSASLSGAKSDFVAFLQFRKLPVSLPSHLLRAGGDRARAAGKWLQKGDLVCDGHDVCVAMFCTLYDASPRRELNLSPILDIARPQRLL